MHVTSRENQTDETKVVIKMSSTDSTEITKTDDSSIVSDSDKSLADAISKKFSSVEIAMSFTRI